MLRPLTSKVDPRLLVGLQTSDDAAAYRLNDDFAMIQTVDFFPPVVDDPYTYGAIAAANALSDIYAMGGEALLALNIVAFPDNLPLDILQRILEGGADKAAEAGIVIAGGHTVIDDEPKYGLAVTGWAHPDQVVTKAGAQPGDVVYLTKPLGTGVITTALKAQSAKPEDVNTAVASMLKLNRAAARLMREIGVHACSDISGFGLIGHGTEMAEKSGVRLILRAASVPLLDSARRYAEGGWLPGGASRNRDYYGSGPSGILEIAPGVDPVLLDLFFDPETSGGLLIAVPGERAAAFETAFAAANEPLWRIGDVEAGLGLVIVPE